tara:strand:- start:127 stop:534 length:408 start_codon:yes stop_codon:yes gene_type:complete
MTTTSIIEYGATLLHNSLKTPDGTILTSRAQHDYRSYEDANGKTYMIDGGTAYVRCSANGDETHLSVWSNDEHELIREHAEWGTYGINGDQPLEYVKIKDMSTEHLEACVKTHQSPGRMSNVFVAELNYRKSNES